MKIEELKVGDWVNSESLENPVYRKVRGLADNYILVSNSKIRHVSGCNDLLPIPITSEILEKNGWEKEECPEGIIYTNGWYRLSRAGQEGSWMFNHYDDFLTTIQSVHELQHLLWALGIDDDLKI